MTIAALSYTSEAYEHLSKAQDALRNAMRIWLRQTQRSDASHAPDDDLAQMRAALAAEGYVWFTPLDGGPRRLVKGRTADLDATGAPEGAARGASDQDTPPGPDYVRCRPLSRHGKRRWIKGVNAPQERG